MGIFSKWFKRETIIDANSVDDPLLKALIGDTAIDRNLALEMPVISSSVDLICNTFAMIPFKLYKEEIKEGKKVTKEVDDDRVRLINDDTTDKLDGFQFKKAICEDYLMGKGGYAHIKKNNNKYLGLFYVQDKDISINKNNDPIFKNYDILVNARKYKDYEFIKLLRNSKDGASGTGLTSEISRALKTAYKRLLYDYDLAVTGGSRKGFIKSQKHLDEKGIKALKDAWENYYSGTANTVILNDGMEFQEASNTSRENEINEKNVNFNKEMKDIFHIGNTYDDFIKNAIMPIATAFATALNRDFLLEKEKKSYYFAPDTKELLKGSLKERYEAYQIAIKNGFKTRNEIRYMEDDDAIKGLDMINLGLGDVLLNAETGEIYTPNTNKLVKMGENSTEIAQNSQENVESVDKSNENISKFDENLSNTEDLEPKGINTLENEKIAENEENGAKKGGEKDESRN
jgi:HK97 family phage portal protein